MWDWIYSLINDAVLPLRILVNSVAARIASIWGTITNTIARWRGKAQVWVTNMVALLPATLRQGLAVLLVLRYILFVAAPRMAAEAFNGAVAWATQRLGELGAWAASELAALRTWAGEQLDGLLAFANRIVAWAHARLVDLETAVGRLIDHVFGPLGTPERLVAWILAPLIEAVTSWVLDNIDALAAAAFRRRTTLEHQAVAITERIVDRFV